MRCRHLGNVVTTSKLKDGTPFQVVDCGHFQRHCTVEDIELKNLDQTPFLTCAGCKEFEPVPPVPAALISAEISEVEKAFNNLPWGSGETVSGPGSTLAATKVIREAIPKLLNELAWSLDSNHPPRYAPSIGDEVYDRDGAKRTIHKTGVDGGYVLIDPSAVGTLGWRRIEDTFTTPPQATILDIPCGDRNWFPDVPGYIGADVVRELIEQNRQKFPGTDFRHLDLITSDLPKADVVFTRDCLVHLPFHAICTALKNIVKSGARWLVTTHFPGRVNHDIPIGSWRPLDLTAKPFCLPAPREIINEGLHGDFADKSLGVWLVDDIREAVAKLNAVPKLTIGMATFRDWPGVWATVESILMHHRECHGEIEIVIVDNDPQGDPDGGEGSHSCKARNLCDRLNAMTKIKARYDHFTTVAGTAAAKGRVFDLATSPAVLVMDCHVLLPTGSLRRLIDWFAARPDSKDLYQGPCIGDGGYDNIVGTHFAPYWGSLMYGQWSHNAQGLASDEPFEIAMQGCGLFACNKSAWPGFHKLLRGFGPEEFHLHQRIRRNGGKCYCLPWLRWCHRFGNPAGSSPPGLHPSERLRGHLITHLDTGAPALTEIHKHFTVDPHSDGKPALTDTEFFDTLRKTVAEFFAETGRADLGYDCPHRGPYLQTVKCEIGCEALRSALPTFACGKHGECAPYEWQQPQNRTMPACLGCGDNPRQL